MEDLLGLISSMGAELARAKDEAEKFVNKGNSTAGTRVRKAMFEIKRMAQEARVMISLIKNR